MDSLRYYIGILVCFALVLTAGSENKAIRRLPDTSYPLKYHLDITTWMHQKIFYFAGQVTIELMIRENTTFLTLNAKDLQIKHVKISDLTTKRYIHGLYYNSLDDMVNIESPYRMFVKNHRIRLHIAYVGYIRTQEQDGFYALDFMDEQHRTTYSAVTHFQPMMARTVLPCYDEPAFKANFTVSITHSKIYTAISNMPAISTSDSEYKGMKTTTFMESPPMSTYMLAFAITNFKPISKESDGIMQRVFLPPNVEKTAFVGLDNGLSALRELEFFFDVPYTLPKLDHLAFPQTESLATKNWGLIIYNEKSFPHDYETKKAVFHDQLVTQFHEMVHQWMGNLVTPSYWNQLWISEGFATYFGYVLTDKMYPRLKSLDHFDSLVCDAILNIPQIFPMSGDVKTREDLNLQLSLTSYTRAPCVLRMFDHAFKRPVFRKAMSNFIKAHSYSVANEDQLIRELQLAIPSEPVSSLSEITKSHLAEIMKSWTHSLSFPVVTITRDYYTNKLHIQQKPYYKYSNELWWIPLNFATKTQPDFENTAAVVYMPPVAEITLNLADFNISMGASDWYVVNTQATGLYRVDYDDENLRRLTQALSTNRNIIHRRNRLALTRDILRSGWKQNLDKIKWSNYAELLSSVNKDDDPYVWLTTINIITETIKHISSAQHIERIQSFMRNLVEPQYIKIKNLTEEELSPGEAKLKGPLTECACLLEVTDCLEPSKKVLSEVVKGERDLTDLLPTDICNGVKVLSDSEFHEVIRYFSDLNVQIGRRVPWEELSCVKSNSGYKTLLNVALNLGLYEGEAMEFLSKLVTLRNTMFREATWEFLMNEIIKLDLSYILYKRMSKTARQIPDSNRQRFSLLLRTYEAAIFTARDHPATPLNITDLNYIWYELDKDPESKRTTLGVQDEELFRWLERV